MPCNKAANEFSRVYNEGTIIIYTILRVVTAFDLQKRENLLNFQTKYLVKLLDNFFLY
jgi:hypothetical protein